MDLLRALHDADDAPVEGPQPILAEPVEIIQHSDAPNDELAIAEIGLAHTRPGTLLLSQSALVGKPWPGIAALRARRLPHLRLQLPGAVKRRKAPRSAGFAL